MLEKHINPNLKEIAKAKCPVGKLIDCYIDIRHGTNRANYLRKESKIVRQEKLNADAIDHYFRGYSPFPLKYLKGFADELQIPLEEIIKINNGKNPFDPNLEEFKKAKCPSGKLIDFYIDLKYGLDRDNYLRKESRIVKQEKLKVCTAVSYLGGRSSFPLKYLKGFVEELQIPLEEIIKVNNCKNPFDPDIKEFKKAKCPSGKLIDFYIDLRHALNRTNYLRKESKTIEQEKLELGRAHGYFNGSHPFPLKYLKGFVEELQIPLEELIEINGNKNPFIPDIKEFKKAKCPSGKLIDFYIDLRYGPSRENYLKKESKTVKQKKLNVGTTTDYLLGINPFPLKYLKEFVNELQIPLEEVIEINNRQNPFEPDLEEFKKAKCPSGKLIEFYADFRYGLNRKSYLRKESKIVKQEKLNVGSTVGYFRGNNSFPLKYLKGFVDELQIPLEEVIEINNRQNPFVPDIEAFKKAKCPSGKLIDFYIDLRYGPSRHDYFKKESNTVKQEKLKVCTATNYVNGRSPFPLKYLKGFVNELQIPYSQINYLIDGDIEKGIARSGNVRIEPGTELILDSVKYYIQQYQKGHKERPSVFYPKKHYDFEKGHGISTKQIYRSLNK